MKDKRLSLFEVWADRLMWYAVVGISLYTVMFHVLCIGICRSGSLGFWRFPKVFHENGEMWKLAEIWPPRPKCIYGDSPTWFLANQRQRPRAEDLTSLLHKCRILWLSQKLIEMVRPLSVSFLFRTSGKNVNITVKLARLPNIRFA